MVTGQVNFAQLAQAGAAALRAGDAEGAIVSLNQVVAQGRADASIWHMLALAHQRLGQSEAMLAAADRALQINNAYIPALMLKAEHYTALGEHRTALQFYNMVTVVAAQMRDRSPELNTALERANAQIEQYTRGMLSHLEQSVSAAGYRRGHSSARFTHAFDLLSGVKRRYMQEPRMFYFPELPQRQFYEREEFDWVDRVESATREIVEELKAVMKEEEEFVPYIQGDPTKRDSSGLADSKSWSAFFLWKDGEPVAGHAERCPKTMAALEGLPICRIKGRAPSILFSRLLPGAAIPPHHGFINTRLICHLPLISPKGCKFRVGNDIREWEQGKVWSFDDTIEHEAINPTDQTRIILIFEVWRPEMTEEERRLVAATIEAVDTFQGGSRVRWEG